MPKPHLLSLNPNPADQIQRLARPIPDGTSAEEPVAQLLRDILWSDPTESDGILGVHAR